MLTIITTIFVSFVIGYVVGYIDRGTRIDSRLDFENLKITVILDRAFSDDVNPTNDGLWKVYSFKRRHTNYRDPSEIIEETAEKAKAGKTLILSYYEPGNCCWSVYNKNVSLCPFDGTQYAGVLEYCGDEKYTLEEFVEAGNKFLNDYYTPWCNGEVYDLTIITNEGESNQETSFTTEYSLKGIETFFKDTVTDDKIKNCEFFGEISLLKRFLYDLDLDQKLIKTYPIQVCLL